MLDFYKENGDWAIGCSLEFELVFQPRDEITSYVLLLWWTLNMVRGLNNCNVQILL